MTNIVSNSVPNCFFLKNIDTLNTKATPDPTQNTYKENFYFKNQGGVPEVALSSKEIPSHKHDIYLSDCSCGKATARGYGGRLPALSNESITYYSDNEGSGYNIDKMEGKPMNNLPPYYTVFFIMKVK
ncbi:MAG: hypothetical protein IPN86_03000 [Saprospiraceae bacterium]|nr:hypothetical protein [Saprospiraceae bacterium]